MLVHFVIGKHTGENSLDLVEGAKSLLNHPVSIIVMNCPAMQRSSGRSMDLRGSTKDR